LECDSGNRLGSVLLLECYFIERPQFVSFVCFGMLLLVLLHIFDQHADRSLWGTLVYLPVVMIVWANMHGGFLIGQAILIYCVVAEGIKFCHRSLKPLSGRNYRILVISSIHFEAECSAVKGRVVLIAMLAVTTLYCVRDEFPRLYESAKSGWVPVQQFPVRAADFIAANSRYGERQYLYVHVLGGDI
jgi:hypothetical protein